ncbi:uncharacterized protein [Branchiostoma lanceolatum]|uniref:uncharacterized protein isoform X2 n=1 Tax=Branchiostoma lanceolatum TaxID=7740 RepID=UPI00345158EA
MASAPQQVKVAESRSPKGRVVWEETPPHTPAAKQQQQARQQRLANQKGRISNQSPESFSNRRYKRKGNSRKFVQRRVVLVNPKQEEFSRDLEDGGSRHWVMRRLSAKPDSNEVSGADGVCNTCGHRSASPILQRGRVSPDVGWLTVSRVEGKKSARLMARVGDITSRMSMALNTFETAFDYVEDDEDSLDDFRAKVDSIDDGEVRVEMKTFIERYREMMAHVEEVNEEREEILMSLSDWFSTDHLYDMGTEWDNLEASLQEAEESGSTFREGLVTAKVASEKLKNMNEQMMKLKQQGRKIGHLTMEKENLQKQVINAFKQVKQKPIDQSEGAVLKHAAAEVNDLLKRIRTEGEDAIAVLEAELQKLLTQLEEQTVKMNMMAAELEEKKLMYQQVMEENTKLTNEKLLMQERMEKTLDEVVRLRKAMKAQGQVEESAGMKVNVKEGKWQDEDGKWYEPATLIVILRGLRVRGAESERETRRLKVKLGEVKAALELKETENDALMIQLKCRPKVMKSKVKVEHTTTTVRSETTEMVQSPGACSQCGRSGQDHTSASPASKGGQDNVFGRVPVPATQVHVQPAPEKDQNLKVTAALTQENEEFKQNLKMTKNNLDHALEEIERLKAELEDLKSRQGQDQYYMGPDAGMVMDISDDEEIEIMHQDYTREDTQSLHTIQESEFGAAAPDQSGLRDGRGSTLPTKSPYHPESLLPGGDASPCPPSTAERDDSSREKEVSVHLIQPDSHLPVPTRSTTLMKRLSHAPEEHLSPEEEPSHENLVVEEFLVKHKGVQCDLQPPVLQTRRTSHQTGSASRPSIFRSQGGFQESEQLLHTLREENKGLASSDTIPRAARKFLKSETATAMLNGEEPTVVEWETTASLKRLQRKLDDITAHILVMTKEAMNFVSKEGGAMKTANSKIRGNISDTSLAGVQNEDEDALLMKHPALIGGAGFKYRVSQAGANCMQLTEKDPEEEEAAAEPGAAMKEKLRALGQHAVDVFGTMMNLAYATVKYQFQDYVHLHKVMKPKHRQQMKELMNLLEVEDDDDDEDDLMYKGSRRRSSILHKYFLDNRMEQRLRKTMQVKGLRTMGSGFKLDTPPRPATDSQQEPRLVLSKSFVQLRSTVSRVGTTASDHRHELEIPKATAPRAGLPVLVVGLGNRKAQTTYPPARKRSIQPWRDSHLYKMTALDPTYRMAKPGAKVAATKLGSGFAVPMKFKEPEPKTFSRPMRKAQVKSRPREVEPHLALAAGLPFPLPTLKPTRHGLQGKRAKGTLSTSKVQENRDQGTVLPLLFVTSKQK